MNLEAAKDVRNRNLHLIGTENITYHKTIADIIVAPKERFNLYMEKYATMKQTPSASQLIIIQATGIHTINDNFIKLFHSSSYDVVIVHKRRGISTSFVYLDA